MIVARLIRALLRGDDGDPVVRLACSSNDELDRLGSSPGRSVGTS